MRRFMVLVLLSTFTYCSRKADTGEASSSDTVIVAKPDTSLVSENGAKVEVEAPEPFSWPFTSNMSGPDMFLTYHYDSMKILLKAEGIEISNSNFGGLEGFIQFDESRLTYTIWEDGTYDLCVAHITQKGYPLKAGLKIGMNKEECMKILKITPADCSGDSQTGEVYFQYTWVNGGGDYGNMEFRFSNTALRSFSYRAPCSNRY